MKTMRVEAPGVRQLSPEDKELFSGMLDLFGRVFDDTATYGAKRPGQVYVERLLANPSFVALVALEADRVIGALVA